MPTAHVPAPVALPSSVNLVADGDKRKAASIRPGFETLADAIKYTSDRVYTPELTVRHQWRPRPLINCVVAPFSDAWGGVGTYAYAAVIPSGAGVYLFEAELEPAHGSNLLDVRVFAYDSVESGTIGASVELYRLDLNVFADLGGDIDELPTPALLASSTTFVPVDGKMGYFLVDPAGSVIVDRERYRYVVQIRGTSGSVLDRWFSARVVADAAAVDRGAG